ncbi:MAG: type III-B CRISPR module RAMP protein Cmr4 [Bacteroidota bacterium]
MSYICRLYRITSHTNIHVGSGKQSYGIIDNLVQRDALTSLPIINGSSLKGALREYCTIMRGGPTDPLIEYVFGKESTRVDKDNDAGKYRFFDGRLLTLPVRSNALPFFRLTAPELLQSMSQFLKEMGYLLSGPAQTELQQIARLSVSPQSALHFDGNLSQQTIYLEDFTHQAQHHSGTTFHHLDNFLGKDLALINQKDLEELADDNHLPVMARNSLEDGRSTNLWYEQVLPRQTSFYTVFLAPEEKEGKTNYLHEFEDLLKQQPLIQIGANASIGQGYCEFYPVEMEALQKGASPKS